MSSQEFGILKNDQMVTAYTLTNDKGMSVTILNYGGIIQSMKVPSNDGLREVVLGYESLEDYEINPSYLGAIIGRTAGRLDKGYLKVDQNEYHLSEGDGEHLLHGGPYGFHQKLMEATLIKLPSSEQLRLKFKALNDEDGFPADVEVEIIYDLNRWENTLKLTMKGISNEKTYMNLTNHSYFNLSRKNGESIAKHELELNVKAYAALDASGLPNPEWSAIEGTALDFTNFRAIETALDSEIEQIKLCKGIDHPFLINKPDQAQGLVKAASLRAPDNAMTLDVYTTQGHLVVYSGNYLSVGEVPSGKSFMDYQGICFETQEKPNMVNTHPNGCRFIDAGTPYHEEINYCFSCS